MRQLFDHILSMLRDRRGSVSVVAGFAAVPIVMGGGVAIDYGRALREKVRLQNAMDLAVIAGASQPATSRIGAATAAFNANLNGATGVTANFTTNADGSLTGTASETLSTTMAAVFGTTEFNLSVSATAAPASSGLPGCILLLDASMQHAFSSRSNSSLDASKCDVRVNSSGLGSKNTLDHWEDSDKANKAAIFVSNSNFKFGNFCAYGSIQGSVTGVGAGCPAQAADPFTGKLPAVSPGACSAGNVYAGTTITSPTPGNTYCGTFTFSGTIPAGIYYIRTASWQTSAKMTLASGVKGTGVTFYFVDATATMDVVGEGTQLSAPTSGTYANYLIFMPDNLTTKQSVHITSLDKNNWSGVMYTPAWNIELHSWSSNKLSSICWVANSMVWDSLSSVSITPGNLSISWASDGTASLSTGGTGNAVARLTR